MKFKLRISSQQDGLNRLRKRITQAKRKLIGTRFGDSSNCISPMYNYGPCGCCCCGPCDISCQNNGYLGNQICLVFGIQDNNIVGSICMTCQGDGSWTGSGTVLGYAEIATLTPTCGTNGWILTLSNPAMSYLTFPPDFVGLAVINGAGFYEYTILNMPNSYVPDCCSAQSGCCPNVTIPDILYAHVSGCGSCNGTYEMDSTGFNWSYSGNVGTCEAAPSMFQFGCTQTEPINTFTFIGPVTCGAIYQPVSVSCDPFEVVFTNVNMGCCGCTGCTVTVNPIP